MKDRTRKDIIDSQQKLKESESRTEQIREEIDVLVQQLLDSEIVKELKSKGSEYLEEKKVIGKLQIQTERKIDKAKTYCLHPIVYLVGYKKHNASNRVITATREDAEYASVKCLECGKQIYTFDKKSDPINFDKRIYIEHSLAIEEAAKYELRPVITKESGMKFADISKEYQASMIEEDEEQLVEKILSKCKTRKNN